jgi:Na+-transporting NADH:ubiquinone oxidoreductase subunit F
MLELIYSLLVISGIGAILALFLEVAHAYIANYGDCQILINEEKDLEVAGGSPLLSTLMQEGIFIPSACGGKGTCSLCKVRVLEGGGPVLPTETPYLDQEEMDSSVRLSCQVKVRNDLKIQIPEELFLIREYRVKVLKLEDLTPEIKGIELQVLSTEDTLTFKPGQYIQLEIPKYKMTKGPEYRAYSVASHPEAETVDLVITKAPKGAVSTFVHDYLKVGDELGIIGPFGDFYLRDSDLEILFIATGSGLAPIMSILRQIEKEEIKRKSSLFFGARKREDLYYYDELKALEKKLPRFSFIPTLSRATEADQWDGEKGRVTNLIERYVEKDSPIEVYICGSPDMVQSCLDMLEENGIPEERIFYDKFE